MCADASQTEAVESAKAELGAANVEAVAVSDAGIVEDHRGAHKFVLPRVDDGAAGGKDGTGKFVVEVDALVAVGYVGVGEEIVRGQGREME